MACIDVRNVACCRGRDWLFRGLSFQLHSGRMLWIRGANGSGKTTLLRLLAGLGLPDEGSIHLPEQATDGSDSAVPSTLYIGHANALKDDLTVTEALLFLAQLNLVPAGPDSTHDALKKLGVFHRREAYIRTLSQGQRRRVALARLALQSKTKLWILDEPFDALDPAGIQVVYQLMSQHALAGGSVVYTSHVEIEYASSLQGTLQLPDGLLT